MMKKLVVLMVMVMAFATIVAAEDWIPCTETDGGQDYFNVGVTTGSHFSQGTYWTMEEKDYCTGYENNLIEYFCDDVNFNPEEFRKEEVRCEYGCEYGACNPPPVPEFGLIAGMVAIAGAVVGFFFLRRKD